jgi:hypothetical protein
MGDETRNENPFCKPICKPDATGRAETGETQKLPEDCAASVGRGQRGDQRKPETPETHVVWLITQRSAFEPLSLPGERPGRRRLGGRFAYLGDPICDQRGCCGDCPLPRQDADTYLGAVNRAIFFWRVALAAAGLR